MFIYIIIFAISVILFPIAGKILIKGLTRIAKYMGWREFSVAFLAVAFAGTIPNLLVGISSALHKIPELSLGDVVGGNILHLTVSISIAVLIAGSLPAASRTVQKTAIVTAVLAILPIILTLDGTLCRIDGLILIASFFIYIYWLFSKKERFRHAYNHYDVSPVKGFKYFLKDTGLIIIGGLLLIVAAEGVVRSATAFSLALNLNVIFVGLFIVSIGNVLPETFFFVASARKKETWMILGTIMGSTIMPATLVLGTVALISPIHLTGITPFTNARIFLFISAILFLIFTRTGKAITRKEAIFLLIVYAIFLATEFFIATG